MRCRRALRILALRCDGRASCADELALDAHLASCSDCFERAARALRIDEGLVGLSEPPIERLDIERVLQGVHGRVAERARERLESSARRSRVWRRVAVAAGLALVFGPRLVTELATETATGPATEVEFDAAEPLAAAELGSVVPPTEPPIEIPAEDLANGAPREHEDLDRTRLAQTQRATREALNSVGRRARGSLASYRAGAGRELALALEAELQPQVGAGWPLVRLVDGALSSRGLSEAGAATALFYLAERGDRLSLASVVRVLERSVEEDPNPVLGQVAVRALLAAEQRGQRVLEDALARPPIAGDARVVALIVDEVEPQARAAVAAGLVRAFGARPRRAQRVGSAPGEPAADLELIVLDALSALAEPGARALIELGEDSDSRERLLVRLAASPQAPAVIAQRFEDASDQAPTADLVWSLELCARFRPDGGPRWLVDVVYEVAPQDALDALAGFASSEGLLAGLRLWQRPGVALVNDARFASLVARSAAHADLAELSSAARASELRDFLIASGRPEVTTLLCALLDDPALRAPDLSAELAAHVLAIGDLARGPEVARGPDSGPDPGAATARTDEAIAALQRLFLELEPRERGPAAATVLCLSRLGGEQAVENALALRAGSTPALDSRNVMQDTRRVLDVLEDHAAESRERVSLTRLARVLEPTLATLPDNELLTP